MIWCLAGGVAALGVAAADVATAGIAAPAGVAELLSSRSEPQSERRRSQAFSHAVLTPC